MNQHFKVSVENIKRQNETSFATPIVSFFVKSGHDSVSECMRMRLVGNECVTS